jgi:hypothetical protein
MAIGVTVAQFRRAECCECFGVGGDLGLAESLDVLGDGLFIGRSRKGGRKNWNGTQKSERKSRQCQLTTIDVHRFLHFYGYESSVAVTPGFVEWAFIVCA